MLNWIRRHLWSHKWERGRNPYRRTCRVCGRHEEAMCWSLETWNYAWWEVFREGDPSKHWTK